MPRFPTVDALAAAAGTALGHSAWHQIDQSAVNTFADVVDDHQWIHVDVDRAATGPYNGTIVHGALTLALIPTMIGEVVTVENLAMGLNYGYDRVRFIRPVPVGSRVRAAVTVKKAAPATGGVRMTFEATVEREGAADPVCVVENIILYLRP
jgi:acyl dehydratase